MLNILDDILSNLKSSAMQAKSGLNTQQYLLFPKCKCGISIYRIAEKSEKVYIEFNETKILNSSEYITTIIDGFTFVHIF